MSKVFVKSEFAPLKRVVMAQSEFAFSSKEDSGDEDFLTEESRDLYRGKDILGKNYKEVFPERQKQWEGERENLKRVLEKYNVEVIDHSQTAYGL